MVHIEPLQEQHRQGFMEIYNYYVQTSMAAWPDQPLPDSFFDRFLGFSQTHPACAMVAQTGQMVGFAMLRPYHWASTLNRTAEITYFIHADYTHRGLGKAALDWLLERGKALRIDRVLASISSHNTASLEFHRKYGFVECGRLPQVGRKNGQEFDVVWMILAVKS